MHYIIIALVVLAMALLAVVSGCSGKTERSAGDGKDGGTETGKSQSAKAGTPLSRQEVLTKLQALARSKPPKKLNPGAMCYEMAGPPQRVDYVCPACGEKTIYASADEPASDMVVELDMGVGYFLEYQLKEARRQVTKLPSLDASLDEKQFCRKCSPGVKGPKLVLVVHYKSDAEPHRCEGISTEDLRLLQEFLAGADKHKDDYDFESPMKKHLPRLEALLGVKLEK